MKDRSEDDCEPIERETELAAVTEQITRRMHAGEAVDLEDYALRYPGLAGSIRRLLPSLRQLAQLGSLLSTEIVSRRIGRETNETAQLTSDPWKPIVGPRTLDMES